MFCSRCDRVRQMRYYLFIYCNWSVNLLLQANFGRRTPRSKLSSFNEFYCTHASRSFFYGTIGLKTSSTPQSFLLLLKKTTFILSITKKYILQYDVQTKQMPRGIFCPINLIKDIHRSLSRTCRKVLNWQKKTAQHCYCSVEDRHAETQVLTASDSYSYFDPYFDSYSYSSSSSYKI